MEMQLLIPVQTMNLHRFLTSKMQAELRKHLQSHVCVVTRSFLCVGVLIVNLRVSIHVIWSPNIRMPRSEMVVSSSVAQAVRKKQMQKLRRSMICVNKNVKVAKIHNLRKFYSTNIKGYMICGLVNSISRINMYSMHGSRRDLASVYWHNLLGLLLIC